MIPIRDVIPSRTIPWMTMTIVGVGALLTVTGVTVTSAPRVARSLLGDWADAALPLVSVFAHAGLFHAVVNLFALWIFGATLEDRFGRLRFLLLYLSSGLVSFTVHAITSDILPLPPAGAAGAVAGVVGVYGGLFSRSRVLVLIPIPWLLDAVEVPAVFFITLWSMVQVLEPATHASTGAFLWPSVAGALTGLGLTPWLRRPDRERIEWWGVLRRD